MDSITQALLGAAVGEAILGKQIGRKGAFLGAIVATIPDLDVIFLPFFSNIERISIHRGFSHSILFSIIASFILAFFLSKIKWIQHVDRGKLKLFTFLTLITHILLDAFTSYGTQLFLPFSNYRVSFDSINIIDPIYTTPLLIGLILSLFIYKNSQKKRIYNTLGLLISTLYLLSTLGIKFYINQQFNNSLKTQHIEYLELLTVPVKLGSLNWYGVAKTDQNLYIGNYSLLDKGSIIFEEFPINQHLLQDIDTSLVNRLKWFSQGFYTVAEYEGKTRLYNMQCDMQGVRTFGDYKAPTAFYFEIKKQPDGSYDLQSDMHHTNN